MTLPFVKTLLFILLSFECQGQLVYHKEYTKKDGLLGDLVYCTFKDSRGLYWMGTDNGLSLFQGDHFVNYQNDPLDKKSILSGKIFAISEDNFGNMWIGTYGNGISIFNPIKNTYLNFSIKDFNPELSDVINYLKHDAVNHKMFVLTDHGAVKINYEALSFEEPFPKILNNEAFVDLYTNDSLDFYSSYNGRVIVKNNISHHVFVIEQDDKLQKLPAISSVACVNKSLYMCSYQGLYKITGHKCFKLRIYLNNKDISDEMINNAVQINDTLVYIVSNGFGIMKTNRISEIIYCKSLLEDNPEIDDNVFSYNYFDEDQTSFVGSKQNMVMIKNAKPGLSFINTKKNLIPDIIHLFPINDTALIVSTEVGSFILSNQELTKIDEPQLIDFNSAQKYRNDSLILFGRFGTYFYKSGKIHQSKNIKISTQNYYCSLKINDSVYLFSTIVGNQIYKWNLAKNIIDTFTINELNGYVIRLTKSNENIFICTSDGLYIMKNEKFERIKLPDNYFVSDVYFDQTQYYISGLQHGVEVLDDHLRFKYKLQNTYESTIMRIFKFKNTIAFVGINSISFLNSDNNHMSYYVSGSDYPLTEFSVSVQSESGQYLYIGGKKSIIKLDMNIIPHQPAETRTFLFNTSSVNNGYYDKLTISSEPCVLNYLHNNLKTNIIKTNSLFFQSNDFEYRLNRSDSFVQLTSNDLIFNGLSPTYYDLEVKDKNASMSFHYPFSITPPWYKTWWFRLIAAIAILLNGIWISQLYYKKRLVEQQKEHEKQLALQHERERIGMDMHDDLGSGLSSIKLISELLKKKHNDNETQSELNEIVEHASSITNAMKEMVWNLNAQNDNVANFIFYIKQYSYLFFEPSHIQFNFIISNAAIPDMLMSAFVRRNLLLVYKEILNNILKHSNAKNARTNVNITNNSLLLNIVEDGIKFDTKKETGNGLGIIERRLKEIGGHIDYYFIDNQVEINVEIKI